MEGVAYLWEINKLDVENKDKILPPRLLSNEK